MWSLSKQRMITASTATLTRSRSKPQELEKVKSRNWKRQESKRSHEWFVDFLPLLKFCLDYFQLCFFPSDKGDYKNIEIEFTQMKCHLLIENSYQKDKRLKKHRGYFQVGWSREIILRNIGVVFETNTKKKTIGRCFFWCKIKRHDDADTCLLLKSLTRRFGQNTF